YFGSLIPMILYSFETASSTWGKLKQDIFFLILLKSSSIITGMRTVTVISNRSLIFLIFIFFMSSCARHLQETHLKNSIAEQKFLIASNASPFKDALRHLIVNQVQAEFDVTIVNIPSLNQISAEDYTIVLIMDACKGWSRFNRTTKSFIDALHDKKKVILFMTAADPDWQFSYGEVDAITSASEKLRIPELSAEIIHEIQKRVSP
ncbi:hypothetical protein ACFL27_22480, partial [candidate division CSSED10-310 bacterium]